MNVCFMLLFLCLSHTELTSVWAQQPTDNSDSVSSQRSSAPSGGITINSKQILLDNLTDTEVDSAKYYTWNSFGPEDKRAQELWVDMSDARNGQVRVHGILSNSYRQAVRVALSFDFPFYGHYLRQITIATGGFIFTGDITHRMLTAAQYIAPLMANFDPSHSKDSTVQYMDNGEVFVIQWEQVRLSGKESEGGFTFQAALHKTGTITFSYRDVPFCLDGVSSDDHPVKAGLSDAFLLRTTTTDDKPSQIVYEYHRIEVDTTQITNFSAVEFTALPNCLQHKTCELCLSSNQTSGCSWCYVLQRCSDGIDRHRQEWLDYGCSEANSTCEDYTVDDSSIAPEMEDVTSVTFPQDDGKESDGWANTGVIASVTAALVLLLALILTVICIKCQPTTASPPHPLQRRKKHWPSFKYQKQQPGYSEVEGDGHEKDSIVEAGPH